MSVAGTKGQKAGGQEATCSPYLAPSPLWPLTGSAAGLLPRTLEDLWMKMGKLHFIFTNLKLKVSISANDKCSHQTTAVLAVRVTVTNRNHSLYITFQLQKFQDVICVHHYFAVTVMFRPTARFYHHTFVFYFDNFSIIVFFCNPCILFYAVEKHSETP